MTARIHKTKIFTLFLWLLIFAVPIFVFAHGDGKESQLLEITENLALLLHIISAVFMAWPLYALVTVNERPKVNAVLGDKVDDFMEGIIKEQSRRCYVFQAIILLTGLYLLFTHKELSFSALLTNWTIIGKWTGLAVLIGLLSYVVFSLQPKIDRLFEELKIKPKDKAMIIKRINSLRLKRKKTAASCLFVLLAILLFAVQIREPFSLSINLAVLALFFLFDYRVFKANIPYGWA